VIVEFGPYMAGEFLKGKGNRSPISADCIQSRLSPRMKGEEQGEPC